MVDHMFYDFYREMVSMKRGIRTITDPNPEQFNLYSYQ